MALIKGKKIWDESKIPDREKSRIEFPSLIRFKDYWYCGFRESPIHNNHPLGRGRIIRSKDGEDWETIKILDWDCADVREPKFSITPEGNLLINTSVYFCSREPRNPAEEQKKIDGLSYTPPEGRKKTDRSDAYYQLEWLGTCLNLPESDEEHLVTSQSTNWISSDGVNWGEAYCCETGINTWRWDVTWHNGMAYSIAQWGKDIKGTLYRTRDGKSWRALKENYFPPKHGGEGAIAFDKNDTAYCLLRGNNESKVIIGKGKAPYYTEWEWSTPDIDYGTQDGGRQEGDKALGVSLGGPVIITLNDGRLVGAGRALGPNRDDGHATLFMFAPEENLLTTFAEMDGTSYCGVREYEGKLWVTYVDSKCKNDIWEVMLAKVDIPE